MKKERKIELVTDDFIEPPGEELNGEQAEIDALLRAVADDCSNEIDFEGIKLRAVKAAEAKKAKRGRLRRALGYGMAAAASLVVGLFVWQAVKGFGGVTKGSAVDAEVPNQENSGLTKNDPVADAAVYVGTVSDDNYKVLFDSADELFPENLPDTMKREVDTEELKTMATGTDMRGSQLDYVCSVKTGKLDNLNVGEARSEKDSEGYWYYWQINEDHYLCAHFMGFDRGSAEEMFKSLANRIAENR